MIAAIVGFAYQVFFLSRTGATPGKVAMGISVRLRERPGVLSVADACRRAFLQTALSLLGNIPVMGSLAGLASLLDLLWPAWDNKKQALHDKIAATNVVVGKQPRAPRAAARADPQRAGAIVPVTSPRPMRPAGAGRPGPDRDRVAVLEEGARAVVERDRLRAVPGELEEAAAGASLGTARWCPSRTGRRCAARRR